jgi:16S rRNA (adenine1518-N6/adenine1519-N6)-dimethyltransferase
MKWRIIVTNYKHAVENLPALRDVIAAHELAAKKSLGQHFLLDLNITRKIARLAGSLDDCTVVEIGPGPGGLTRALLLEGANDVIAIERDRRAVAALQDLEQAAAGHLKLIEEDALEIDLAKLSSKPIKIIANLPYNISTQLLVNWLHAIAQNPQTISCMVLMFQKEVAERLTAVPRTKDYGRLSILTQWLCDAKAGLQIGARAFTPPPKVDSTVVILTPRAAPVPCDIGKLERVTASAFGQRRKMLRQSLKQVWDEPQEKLKAVDINPTARAEELSISEFVKLANLVTAS